MPKDINRHEAWRLLEGGAQLVEILPSSEYEEDHLPGAVNLPLTNLDRQAEGLLDRNRPVMVYCWDIA